MSNLNEKNYLNTRTRGNTHFHPCDLNRQISTEIKELIRHKKVHIYKIITQNIFWSKLAKSGTGSKYTILSKCIAVSELWCRCSKHPIGREKSPGSKVRIFILYGVISLCIIKENAGTSKNKTLKVQIKY